MSEEAKDYIAKNYKDWIKHKFWDGAFYGCFFGMVVGIIITFFSFWWCEALK